MYGPVLLSKKLIEPEAAPDERVIQLMMWGMIPPWHVGTPTKHGLTTNNCRIEGIQEKKLFREPLRKNQRCVVLCDGFYEWKSEPKKVKQPYFIHFPQPDGVSINQPESWESKIDELWSEKYGWKGPKPLTMAGLFDTWKSEGGETIYSYSVVTMESSPAVSWIHERMPAILDSDEEIGLWLDPLIPAEEALSLLKPSVNLLTYPVSTLINSVRNQDLSLLQPVDLNKPKPLCSSGKLMANWLSKSSPAKQESKGSDLKESIGPIKRLLEDDPTREAKKMKPDPDS